MRLTAVLALLAFGLLRLPAQTTTSFVVLHTFSATSGGPATNSDGAAPGAGLVLSGNTLYGTTSQGGAAGYGTVFQVNTNGSGFTTLYNFTNGTDGAAPMAPLLLANGALYGTTSAGGVSNEGTIFLISTAGTNFSTLYAFTNGVDGARPEAGLLLAGGTLYGTTVGTSSGSSYGGVFRMNTNGSNFAVLHNFSVPVSHINSDGFLPTGPLTLQGGLVYGATTDGGSHGSGTLFDAATNGSSFDSFYAFAATTGYTLVNGGGAYPQGGVIASDGILYGAAFWGGGDGWGTVYTYNTAGSGFQPIYLFTGGEDYINPQGPLLLSSNTLYGTTAATIFSVSTNGTEFANLFSTNADDFSPNGGLVLTGQSFYGTTQINGVNGNGMVFGLVQVPAAVSLTIQQAADAVILTWPNPVFVLQSAPALTGPFTNVPAATSPYTNVISGSPAFFRLLAN
jgi:uncharacterized repeat protein (TIGR03803 family)